MKRHKALIPLSHQHHDALALCVQIDRKLSRSEDIRAARLLRRQALDIFELSVLGHFEVEEKILFPSVTDALPDPQLIDQLLAEHVQLRAAFKQLEATADPDLADTLLALRELLDLHIRKEERILFESIQEYVPEDDMVPLGERIAGMLPSVCALRPAGEPELSPK